METHLAFLRRINVSGKKILKMQELVLLFESFGFNNVKTYLQTGNVLFDSDEIDSAKIINDGIFKVRDYRVTVILRSKQELLDIAESKPFKDYDGDVKYYITFLAKNPQQPPTLPIRMNEVENEVFKLEKHKR